MSQTVEQKQIEDYRDELASRLRDLEAGAPKPSMWIPEVSDKLSNQWAYSLCSKLTAYSIGVSLALLVIAASMHLWMPKEVCVYATTYASEITLIRQSSTQGANCEFKN